MLKDFLEGKPFRHPLHPLLVHLPIGFFFLGLLLDLASLAFSTVPGLVRGAFYSMLIGIITALVAAIPGFVDFSDIRKDHPAKRIATAHMILNLIVVAIYGVDLGIRSSSLEAAKIPWLPLILSLIAIGLLFVSGYLGGRLVYDNGVAVGRHRRHTPLPEETLCFSTSDFRGDLNSKTVFVPVAAVNRLKDRETLRVEIDGQAIAVAKFEGDFFAVQEFCTHRFGPLSEGVVKDGKIECPWHRSCFELRTGKVAEGPAKMDLKTFPVEIRDGKICIAVPHKTK